MNTRAADFDVPSTDRTSHESPLEALLSASQPPSAVMHAIDGSRRSQTHVATDVELYRHD